MNIEKIDKWLDNEYGVSYTRLEELHDFVVEQDLKHREEKDKEIERLNNIIDTMLEFAAFNPTRARVRSAFVMNASPASRFAFAVIISLEPADCAAVDFVFADATF